VLRTFFHRRGKGVPPEHTAPATPTADLDARSDHVVAVVLAEFAALRAEIDRRSSEQSALLSLSITGTAALWAFMYSKQHYTLLPLVPFLSLALGARWLDQHRRIRDIGDYIKSTLNKHLCEPTGLHHALANETEVERRPGQGVLSVLVVATIFLPPLVAAVLPFWPHGHRDGWDWENYLTLYASVVAFCLSWVLWVRDFFKPTWDEWRRLKAPATEPADI